VTHVAVGSMNPLAARSTDERVVVQRGDDGNAPGARDRGQIEGQIQQVVDMDDVRLQGVHDLRDLIADAWGAIGVGE